MSMMNMMIMILMISNLMLIITSLVSINMKKNHNMMNMNFECGFNEKTILKVPFSTNFFMIAILFLIFDLEVSLITPLIFMNNLSKISMLITMILIILILTMLMNEWMVGMMEWSK